MPPTSIPSTYILFIGGVCVGAGATLALQLFRKQATKKDPESNHAVTRQLVWNNIGGALNAALMHTGDKLGLYEMMKELCRTPGSSFTALDLAEATVRHKFRG